MKVQVIAVVKVSAMHRSAGVEGSRCIWRNALSPLDEATFWARVQDKVVPDRGTPTPPSEALPADLVHLLISRVGVDEAEVARMGKEEAVARLQRYWIEGA